LGSTGFWGHKNRVKALYEYATGEFVLQTSIQDYYINTAVAEILSHRDSSDLVYFNCIHCHLDFKVLDSKLVQDKIDWGSLAVRLSIARTVGIEDPEYPCSDGRFAAGCARVKNIRIRKIDKILTVHS
jgi:hypothetical protein